MPEVPFPEMSDEALFVRIGGRIYVVPSIQLEDFRRSKFEGLKGGQVDEILNKAPTRGEAVLIDLVVVANADFIPPYGDTGVARKSRAGAKTGRKASAKTSTKTGAKAGTKTGAGRRPRGTKG
jgi:hypothetical protein